MIGIFAVTMMSNHISLSLKLISYTYSSGAIVDIRLYLPKSWKSIIAIRMQSILVIFVVNRYHVKAV